MIKKILLIVFVLMLTTVCQSGASIVYHLNISDIDYTGVAAGDQIADFAATINGDFGTDWVIGTVFNQYATDWYFQGGVPTSTSLNGGGCLISPPRAGI